MTTPKKKPLVPPPVHWHLLANAPGPNLPPKKTKPAAGIKRAKGTA